jgi:hypothetical protein
MKKTLIVALMMVAGIAYGETATQEDLDKICVSYGNAAESLMQARQSGVSMSSMMAPLTGNPAAKMMRPLIIEAFTVPRYSTGDFKRQAVNDFRAKAELACFKAYSK